MSDYQQTRSRGARSSRDTTPQPTVLETIARAFSLLLAHPYLLILPLVADLATWLGIQFSAIPLTNALQRSMIEQGGENGPEAARQIADLGERFRVNDVATWLLPSIFGGLPRDSVLNALTLFLVPGLATGVDRAEFPGAWGEGLGRLRDPANGFAVIGIAMLMFGLATLLTVAFRVPIARAVRDDSSSFRTSMHDAFVGWIRLVMLILILGIVGMVAIVPILLVTAAFVLIGINLIGVLSIALFIVGGLAAMYSLFVFDAILVNRVGPIRGLVQSYAVVRANFGQTVRFAVVYLLIATGILRVWQTTVDQIPGIFLALAGNALVGTALTIASMTFFFDRLAGMPAGYDRPPRVLRRLFGTG